MGILDYVWIGLLSIGGTSIAIRGLAKWLGDSITARIQRNEQAELDREADLNRHALSLEKSSYEQHLSLILDYYDLFYRHYRRCQITARADALKLPSGETISTRDRFLGEIDDHKAKWETVEGRMRLLLPNNLLAINEEAVGKFNEFNRAVQEFTTAESFPRRKELIFREIESIKQRLELGLRSFLRTEKLVRERGDS
jgi:hypothetical protein